MRRRIPTIALTALGVIIVGVAAASAAPVGAQEADLTICHRTNSNANPYILVTTNANGQNGGTDHLNEHLGPLWNDTLKKQKIEWGDVIPPAGTEANPNGSVAYQELIAGGGNFDLFVRNGCVLPPDLQVPTHAVTLDKVTTGGTAPAASTDFTFTVTCESGTVTSPVLVAAEDAPVTIATGVAEDDLCTVTESATNGAASTTYQVNGGNNIVPAGTAVTFGVGAEVAIVATNTFADPTTPAQVGGVQVTTTTTAPAEALAVTGSPATYWYLLAGFAFLLGGTALYGSTSRRLLHVRR